jgi:hypothetical protein
MTEAMENGEKERRYVDRFHIAVAVDAIGRRGSGGCLFGPGVEVVLFPETEEVLTEGFPLPWDLEDGGALLRLYDVVEKLSSVVTISTASWVPLIEGSTTSEKDTVDNVGVAPPKYSGMSESVA